MTQCLQVKRFGDYTLLRKILLDINSRAVLEETIPGQLIQTRKVAGIDLSYVSGNFVIDALNRAFGYAWSWKIDSYWIQPSEPKKNRDRNSGTETLVAQPPVAHVVGTLTVYLKDEHGDVIQISKSGAGSKSVLGGSSEQESIFKSASTDALKKAASLFGIGGQLYRDKNEQNYFNSTLGMIHWDQEIKDSLEDDMKWLDKCMDDSGFSSQDIDDIGMNWSAGKYRSLAHMPPYDFKKFINYLKEAKKAAKLED